MTSDSDEQFSFNNNLRFVDIGEIDNKLYRTAAGKSWDLKIEFIIVNPLNAS